MKKEMFQPIFFAIFMKGFLITICLVASISLIISLTPHFSNNYARSSAVAVTNNNIEKYIIKEEEDEETNISHILFGIGGSAKTWHNRSRYSDLWWRPKVTRGFVWLDEEPHQNEPWPETSPPYRVSQDTSEFKYNCWFGNRTAVRIARIVKESFELGLTNVRWYVMGDDDTVFFTENLVAVLGKYDYNQMYYIGGNSESVEQNVVCSYSMAFGGGGIAISYPLAAVLVKILDGCINRYHYMYGSDQKIGGCMAEIGVPLTHELGFHQMDIKGSPRGILAAHPVAPLVSLHHLGKLHPLFPSMNHRDSVKKLIEAYEKDPSRIVQQTLCYDLKRNWSLSVSWGYSVQLYPWLMNARELGFPVQTFNTWLDSKEPFTFDTRPNYVEPCKRPIEYFLDQVVRLQNGATLTSYSTIIGDDFNNRCENQKYKPALAIHMVNVTAPILSPLVWRQLDVDDDNGIRFHIHIPKFI
ncbi:hypothetical protein RND71_031211 [Anisodus tanguticus]|uniref:Uncharacterized protein n=1 Tax=Anisodus tanguticus TaxID=243964 RepID=A0AAE1RC31_9SOLA|nr:hypothetical protein RND71_031211 [Anisodus tanguticus]